MSCFTLFVCEALFLDTLMEYQCFASQGSMETMAILLDPKLLCLLVWLLDFNMPIHWKYSFDPLYFPLSGFFPVDASSSFENLAELCLHPAFDYINT